MKSVKAYRVHIHNTCVLCAVAVVSTQNHNTHCINMMADNIIEASVG